MSTTRPVVCSARIRTGQSTSNVTFGGPRRNRLFITSSQYLMSIYVGATGLQRP
jgi:gluconolactonase